MLAGFFSILLIVSRLPAGQSSLVERFTPCQPGLLRHVDLHFLLQEPEGLPTVYTDALPEIEHRRGVRFTAN